MSFLRALDGLKSVCPRAISWPATNMLSNVDAEKIAYCIGQSVGRFLRLISLVDCVLAVLTLTRSSHAAGLSCLSEGGGGSGIQWVGGHSRDQCTPIIRPMEHDQYGRGFLACLSASHIPIDGFGFDTQPRHSKTASSFGAVSIGCHSIGAFLPFSQSGFVYVARAHLRWAHASASVIPTSSPLGSLRFHVLSALS